jgi:hypothetical protein
MCVIDYVAPKDLADLLTLEYSADSPWLCPTCKQDIINTAEQYDLKAYFIGHVRESGFVFDRFELEKPETCVNCGHVVKEVGYLCHQEGTGLAENLFSATKGD